jgi:hypothetical protein
MAAIRIRGTWRLTLSHYEGDALGLELLGQAVLEVTSATRAGVEGELILSQKRVPVHGKVKPGSPAVVTLHEVSTSGGAVKDGLEAVLYIPPWWPNIDYSYDYITGTMTIGSHSMVATKKSSGFLISVSGVQPF